MLRHAIAGCTGLTLRVNMAVDTVTTTGRCTSAHSGMLTCMTLPHHVISSCGPGTISHTGHVTQATTDSKNADASRRGSRRVHRRQYGEESASLSKLTSGVNIERGTRVQKKPRDTQCVANLRMPK